MFKNRKIYSCFLIVMIVFLSGCILFRFLAFRDQLKNFEQNFGIDDKDGLELIFKDPVLRSSDMEWLMSTGPYFKEESNDEVIWTYKLIKRYRGRKNESGNFHIPVKMKFNDDLLTSMAFPERFLKYFSKDLFGKFMESMGNTQVKKFDQSSKTNVANLKPEDIPTSSQFEEMIGLPYKRIEYEDYYSYTYRYIYRNDSKSKKNRKFYGIKFTLNFDKETDRMEELVANIKSISMTIDFSDVL